jgi:hypothetical protein
LKAHPSAGEDIEMAIRAAADIVKSKRRGPGNLDGARPAGY